MVPIILSPIAGLLLYFGLRRTKRVTVVYTILLLLTFIPIIPIFFTYLIYTNSIIRDTILIIFFAVIIASLIQKGLIQRIIAILFLLLIILKGPVFDIYFPPTFDIAETIEVKKFKFDNYPLIFERTIQPPHPENDIYHWRAKKYYVGQILFNWISVTNSSDYKDKCIQTLYVSRVDSYEKGTTSLERIVNYDTCKNKIISIEKALTAMDHKQRVRLLGFSDKNEVVYDTKVAKFFFSKNSIINYCNKKDTTEHNNFVYRQVVDYLMKHQSNSLIIPDTLGTELVPDSTVNILSKGSTLIRVRNQKSEYAWVTDAMDWTLLDLIKNGDIKIYDKRINNFVDYVFLDKIDTRSYGEARILSPSDSLIFSKMLWIQ